MSVLEKEKKVLCPMSDITCLHNVLWSLKKEGKKGQHKGKQTVAFVPASTPFVVKVMTQGLTLKQACCNYCKAFSCSYIFIFYLGVLENEHMEGGQSRWRPKNCISIAVVNWSGPKNRGLLLAPLSHLWKLRPWSLKPWHLPRSL